MQNVTGAAAKAMWTMRRFIFPDFPFFGRLTDVFTRWMGKKRASADPLLLRDEAFEKEQELKRRLLCFYMAVRTAWEREFPTKNQWPEDLKDVKPEALAKAREADIKLPLPFQAVLVLPPVEPAEEICKYSKLLRSSVIFLSMYFDSTRSP